MGCADRWRTERQLRTSANILAVLFAIVALTFAPRVSSLDAQEKQSSRRRYITYDALEREPASLSAIANKATLIVKARVGESRLRAQERGSGEYMVLREHALSVMDVVKQPAGARLAYGSSIWVAQPGGALEVNGVEIIVRNSLSADLETGREYLLFLEPLTNDTAYTVTHGAFSAYRFDGVDVEVPPAARRLSEFKGAHRVRAQELIALLRSVERVPR